MNTVIKLLTLFSLGLIMAFSAIAHGPTPQKIDEKIIINADVAKVWDKLKEFDSLEQWHTGIDSIEMEDETTRVVTLKEGGKITDSLDDLNDQEHYISYRLLTENIDAFPVSFYTITIQVEAADNGSEVSWSGRFYRADTGNFPPENLNDEAAVKAMTEYAQAGLKGLKDLVEN